MYIISIIMIMIIIFIAVHLSSRYKEHFQQKQMLVDNSKNVKNSMQYNKELFHQLLLIMSRKRINNDTLNMLGIDTKNNIELYVDPYINYYFLKNRQTFRKYDEGIFLCITPHKWNVNDCIWNMENKTIAYNYISDYLFIQAIIKAYRQDIKKVNLIKINDNQLSNGSINFDMFFTYAVIGSDYMLFLEKSLYYINGLIDVDVDRIKAFYPFIKEDYRNMREYFNNESMKNYINETNNVLIPIMQYSIIDLDYIETFITRLELPEDYFDTTENKDNMVVHSCYGNKNINNKYECDSAYNYDGTPKKYYSKWDTTCQADEDCPYYKANKNYTNKRGGCDRGFCEFPVGIKRVGFSQYEDSGLNAPLCYNCANTLDFDCCKRQKNPDYVFAGDYNDRVSYNMKTVIDKLDIENY